MNILVAIDSFKGSATSFELNQAVARGWQTVHSTDQLINVPIADGGEGTAQALFYSLGGKWQKFSGGDLLFRKHESRYLITQWQGKKIAVIESAEVIGIDLLEQATDQTIRLASSFALGEIIKDALAQRVDEIIVTLGGSGCSDGGLGLLQSLGAKLEGVKDGNPLLTTEKVNFQASKAHFSHTKLRIAADVTSPYTGEKGAAKLFGKQKGASPETIDFLEKQAKKLAKQWSKEYQIDLEKIPGSGAAGGIGGALFLLGAQMINGFELISQMIELEAKVKQADWIVTGEGKIDQQTIHGKVPYGVAMLAKKYKKPIIAFCGSRQPDLGELTNYLPAVFSIQLGPIRLREAMEHERTMENIAILAGNICQLIRR
ncbi:glycerate kinase [Enterococcus thailandicus]|uniref:Glycerate kinase n=1 Tax=Enterococcus thailandicus TaxID=417368 RepID=A0A179ENY2_ENTTH|nr:glycerate kinase [Enterococcus thailandicus]OAQ54884.1 glycerate kinase [Enterococcus thailandicus]